MRWDSRVVDDGRLTLAAGRREHKRQARGVRTLRRWPSGAEVPDTPFFKCQNSL